MHLPRALLATRIHTLIRGWCPVLHDDRHAAIRRILRLAAVPQILVRETPHLGDLVAANAGHLNQPARRIGSIG